MNSSTITNAYLFLLIDRTLTGQIDQDESNEVVLQLRILSCS